MMHPTIRQITATAKGIDLNPSHLEAAKTALLVIDFQNEYFTGKLPIPDAALAMQNAQRLIQFADDHNITVIHVQHVSPVGSPIFALGQNSVDIHPDIQPQAHHQLLQKPSVSAFVSTDLDQRLKQLGIEQLIITGLMTHACVTGAARDAVPLGYRVIVVEDACATRSLEQSGKACISYQSLHSVALAALADIFASILTSDEVLQLQIL